MSGALGSLGSKRSTCNVNKVTIDTYRSQDTLDAHPLSQVRLSDLSASLQRSQLATSHASRSLATPDLFLSIVLVLLFVYIGKALKGPSSLPCTAPTPCNKSYSKQSTFYPSLATDFIRAKTDFFLPDFFPSHFVSR
jgi:hypothetical protein